MALFLAVTLSNEDKNKLHIPYNYAISNSSCPRYEDPSAYHITMKKIAENDQNTEIIRLLSEYQRRCTHKKFNVNIKNFYHFDGNIEWMGVNDSLPLYEMKKEIETLAKEMNITIAEDKFSYTPHVTVGFDFQENEGFNHNFDSIPVLVDNITLWGFDEKVNGTHISDILYTVSLK